MKQNVGFQGGCPLKKSRLDQILNVRLSAIFYFHMPDIWQTVIDGCIITMEQKVRFERRMHPEKFPFD